MKMKHRKIIIFSLVLFAFITLVATTFEVLGSDKKYLGIFYLIVMLYGVGIEVTVLMLLGLYHLLKGRIFKRVPGKMPVVEEAWKQQQIRRQHLGKAYLLSAGLVLLIGFSTCLGGAYLLAEVFSK